MGGAVDMCSGLGACRKKLDGTMCPSYMATQEEADSTRGRANVLRLAMAGRIGEAGLGDEGVYRRARSLPRMPRVQSRMSGRRRHGAIQERVSRRLLVAARRVAARARARARTHAGGVGKRVRAGVELGHEQRRRQSLAGEKWLGIDRRRALADISPRGRCDRRRRVRDERSERDVSSTTPSRITTSRRSAWPRSMCFGPPACARGWPATTAAAARKSPKGCSGRRASLAERNASALHPARGCRPEDRVLRAELPFGRARRCAVAASRRGAGEGARRSRRRACCSRNLSSRPSGTLPLKPGPAEILLHGHCHQKSMGLLAPAKSLLAHIPGATVVDLDAGCCGMAGSFGYRAEHFDVSRAIGERKLLPAVRNRKPGTVVVAAGTSCRHQVKDFTGERAVHPAVLLRSLASDGGGRMNLAYVSLAALSSRFSSAASRS